MSLVLYFGSGSPFAWRVQLALEHKGIAYEARRLLFDRGDTRSAEYRAINPRGKVPTIVHDGQPLRESGVILEYLEEVWPEPPLLPREPLARARVRLLAREADDWLGTPLRRLFGQTLFRPKGDGDATEIAAARNELEAELARWEELLVGDWLAGALSLADFTLYPHLRLLRRVGERLPQHSADALIGPRLGAWMGRVEALPYYARTLPPHWRE
jgi:glutathione S-transferase